MINIRTLAMLVMAAALNGCGLVDAIFKAPEKSPVPSVWVPGDPQPPLNANSFVLSADTEVVGEIQVIEARETDTFADIARAYGLGFDELEQANPGIDAWLPGEGTRILLPTQFVLPDVPREGIVLNIAAKRLFYFPPAVEGEPRRVETYPIGIGREGWATPTGTTTVVSKARDPVWFVPATIRKEHAEAGDPLPAQVPPGPDNPLGNRVLALGIPGYLIHGTNKPAGVGMRVSHGCVRLYPQDIEMLFEKVPVGTPVRLVNQPYLLGWRNGELYLEAHPPLEEDSRDWTGNLPGLARASLVEHDDGSHQLDIERLSTLAREQRGIPLPVLTGSLDVNESVARARPTEHLATYAWLTDEAATD